MPKDESEFLIQIIHRRSGEVVRWAPGLEIEHEFEANLLKRVEAKGVGAGRTTKHVLADVDAALKELLYDLKKQV